MRNLLTPPALRAPRFGGESAPRIIGRSTTAGDQLLAKIVAEPKAGRLTVRVACPQASFMRRAGRGGLRFVSRRSRREAWFHPVG